MIPLCEPVLGAKELEYVTDCIKTGWVSSAGEYVVRFEKALADYVGTARAVACNCGTSAIHIGLQLAGVQPGEEVLVPSVTFIATANPVRYLGAYPVFIDCDDYCNIDVAGLERFLQGECERRDGATFNRRTGRRIAAIIPVHVFGTPADMSAIIALADANHVPVVEDATESLGSTYKGRQCGGLAPISCLSFNGNKIVTSGGGGAILTDDEDVAKRAKSLTTQAKEDGIEYVHHAIGYNYRMNNLLAALGLAQLETIDERLQAKRANFALYEAELGRDRLIGQPVGVESNRWFYGYVSTDAEAKTRVITDCLAAGIQVRPLWTPVHLQKPYLDLEAFEIRRAPWFYDRIVNLPCSVNLTAEQIDQVVSVVRHADP